jgi:cellulose synthase/poly-beta-1,6-N-acetylglucosamine synthase-like glycosyltransferase
VIEAAAALAAAHFVAPLAYYSYARRWLRRPWGVEPREGHTPTITIIIPTYNEAPLIEAKLDDIARQNYPPDKFQNMVADSALTEDIPDKPQHNHQDAKKSTAEKRGIPHHSYNTPHRFPLPTTPST